MTEPRVSVVIPTYNRARLLPRAVGSVLAQTFEDWELIIVDDGSDDDTPDVIAGFEDARIRCIRHERNLGVSAARNTGIAAARGEYVTWFDDDDEWLPDALAPLVALLDAEIGANGVYSWADMVDSRTGRRYDSNHVRLSGDVFGEMFACGYRLEGACLYRTSAAKSVAGFPEGMNTHEDFVWDYRFLRTNRVKVLPRVGLLHHNHDGPRLTTRPVESSLDDRIRFFAILESEFADAILEHPRRVSALYCGLAGAFARSGRWREAFRYLFRAFRRSPIVVLLVLTTKPRLLGSLAVRFITRSRGGGGYEFS